MEVVYKKIFRPKNVSSEEEASLVLLCKYFKLNQPDKKIDKFDNISNTLGSFILGVLDYLYKNIPDTNYFQIKTNDELFLQIYKSNVNLWQKIIKNVQLSEQIEKLPDQHELYLLYFMLTECMKNPPLRSDDDKDYTNEEESDEDETENTSSLLRLCLQQNTDNRAKILLQTSILKCTFFNSNFKFKADPEKYFENDIVDYRSFLFKRPCVCQFLQTHKILSPRRQTFSYQKKTNPVANTLFQSFPFVKIKQITDKTDQFTTKQVSNQKKFVLNEIHVSNLEHLNFHLKTIEFDLIFSAFCQQGKLHGEDWHWELYKSPILTNSNIKFEAEQITLLPFDKWEQTCLHSFFTYPLPTSFRKYENHLNLFLPSDEIEYNTEDSDLPANSRLMFTLINDKTVVVKHSNSYSIFESSADLLRFHLNLKPPLHNPINLQNKLCGQIWNGSSDFYGCEILFKFQSIECVYKNTTYIIIHLIFSPGGVEIIEETETDFFTEYPSSFFFKLYEPFTIRNAKKLPMMTRHPDIVQLNDTIENIYKYGYRQKTEAYMSFEAPRPGWRELDFIFKFWISSKDINVDNFREKTRADQYTDYKISGEFQIKVFERSLVAAAI